MRGILVSLVLLLLLPDIQGRADTIVMKKGRDIEDVVVSRQDERVVVINPWNSRHPDMTWEIPEKNFIPRERVEKVVIQDPPLVELRRRFATGGLTPEEREALIRFCEENRFKKEAKWLQEEPEAPSDAYRGRVRRSAALPKGLQEKVALTFGSEAAPGATYCLYVPRSYDATRPTPLVVALHGGGRGGVDATIVTGSGEEAMNFYREEAERWGWIVVCPTALAAPWSHKQNEAWLDALLEEMCLLYNVDESRIYLTGHSMGGFGTWYWGPKRAELWAAISPCAGGGGPAGIQGKDLPVYIFHGTDDRIVGPGSDRSAAKALAGGRKPHDFVYTELDGVGHGFPASVRAAIFRFFAGRRKDVRRTCAIEPVSSFDRKVSREEKRIFGDPRKEESADDETDVDDLVDALERGGGGAEAAAEALGAHKDEKVAKKVARVLRSARSNADVRIHACRALGAIGLEACIRPLEKALRDEDYRVAQAAVQALGETRLPEAAQGVAAGIAVLGAHFDASVRGDAVPFRAYEVRLEGLRIGVEAAGKVPPDDDLRRAVREDVVARVFLRPEPLTIHGEQDPRFRRRPSQARLALARAWLGTLAAWGGDGDDALVGRVADAWRERQSDLTALLERRR